MTEWITNRMPPEKDSIFAKFYGTTKWLEQMFLKNSEPVLVTIEHEGKRLVSTANTFDGKWKCNYLEIYKEAKVVAWMPYPEQYKG